MKRYIGLIAIILWSLILTSLVLAQDSTDREAAFVLEVKGPVSPVMLGYIERGIAAAEIQNAEVVIIELDTPGGQVDLTQKIVQAILAADVPVVVYVYPPGAFAASAGTFITLAGHAAAMAPQTTIGAASPVTSEGADLSETMQAKAKNIMAADIKGLAERRGEAVMEWATDAITEAKAANAQEALELGVVDFIATDARDLLDQLDGFEVQINQETRQLNTAQASLVPFEMTIFEEILSIILLPQIALLLLSIGPLAIIYELMNPGGYISGVIGIICLLLGLYAVGQLPVNYAGMALILLAFILFGAEVFTPTHGVLSLTGTIAFALGGLLLFNTAGFDYQIPAFSVLGISAVLGIFFFFLAGKALGTLRMKPASGAESMIGQTGIVKVKLDPQGIILAEGTRWQAIIDNNSGDPVDPIEENSEVEILAIEGLRLRVRAKS